MAELAVLHLLALSRRSDQVRACLRQGLLGEPVSRGLAARRPPSWAGPYRPGGSHPATAVWRRLAGMGRRSRSEMDAAVVALLDEYRPLSELHSTLAATGLLVVCLPLTAGTRASSAPPSFRRCGPARSW